MTIDKQEVQKSIKEINYISLLIIYGVHMDFFGTLQCRMCRIEIWYHSLKYEIVAEGIFGQGLIKRDIDRKEIKIKFKILTKDSGKSWSPKGLGKIDPNHR